MSGHSKWSTIKRQKESQDIKRGLLFSKLSRAITIAARGGASQDTNFKLRLAIDRARTANMPKDNIDRAISKASGGEAIEEVMYEGFGPGGVAVIVQVATSNKNRTAQEMKNLFERNGGRLATPGSVAYQFEQVGQLLISKTDNTEEQILSLIDAGVQDVEETPDGIEAYVPYNDLGQARERFGQLGFSIQRADLVFRPKTHTTISDKDSAQRVVSFLENLENHDDVQNVYANIDISDELLR